ncbi:chitinase 2 isoform X1 [Rhodnius prolixus]|uniref:chitinase 2 isoform X1 n=1 Tax=Rhodnius prolixus TaxID=13249 RepID=UPI003D18DE63
MFLKLLVFTIFSSILTTCYTMSAPNKVTAGRGGKVVVCYVGTWAAYRPGRGAFSIDEIEPDLCTHIVYSFAGLNTTTWTITSLDPYMDLEDDYGKGMYKKMTSLKKSHPGLKITLAIGGWNEGSANYSILAADPAKRETFTRSVMNYVRKFQFDGVDLDWEFPTQRGGQPEDKYNFVALIKDLKSSLTAEGYILTAALSASLDTLKAGYDLLQVYRNLDLIHLMCYDYHGLWETQTGANAPLGPPTDPLTVEATVKYVLNHGVKPDKLVLGVPMYGRTFLLANAEESSGRLGEPSVKSAGFQGPFTRTDGFLGFNEICNELRTGNWTEHWDQASSTPFANHKDRIISYDNVESIKSKVSFAMDLDLAGIMTWSIDTDDFRGDCAVPGDPTPAFPLLRAINNGIAEALAARSKNKTTPDKKPNSVIRVDPLPIIVLALAALMPVFL